MFKLNQNYQIDRKILKCEFIRYSPAGISTKNTPNSRIYNNVRKEGSAIFLLTSYLELIFEVINKTDKSR